MHSVDTEALTNPLLGQRDWRILYGNLDFPLQWMLNVIMPASLVEGAGVQGLPLVIGRVTKAILLPPCHSHIFPLELRGR